MIYCIQIIVFIIELGHCLSKTLLFKDAVFQRDFKFWCLKVNLKLYVMFNLMNSKDIIFIIIRVAN